MRGCAHYSIGNSGRVRSGNEYGVPNGGPLSFRIRVFHVLCRSTDRMVEVAHKYGSPRVFVGRARIGNENGCYHCHGGCLPANPLTDRHSMVSPEFNEYGVPRIPPNSPDVLSLAARASALA